MRKEGESYDVLYEQLFEMNEGKSAQRVNNTSLGKAIQRSQNQKTDMRIAVGNVQVSGKQNILLPRKGR